MDKERYSRSSRDDRDRDSSADRSPEREATRRHQVRDRDGDSRRRDSDRYRSSSRRYDREEDERDRARDREESRDRDKHHERSKDKEARSKRKEREEENLNREGKKKKSRFEEGSRAMNGASGVEIVSFYAFSLIFLGWSCVCNAHIFLCFCCRRATLRIVLLRWRLLWALVKPCSLRYLRYLQRMKIRELVLSGLMRFMKNLVQMEEVHSQQLGKVVQARLLMC